jgi:DNA-binding IclR family transcriptional regulator
MLAALPTQQVRALYADRAAFDTRPGSRLRSLSALQRALVDVRRDGFAREDGEVTAGLSSVAVAVTDPVGYPLAAVAATFVEATTPPQAVSGILGHVRDTAALLRLRLTGQSVLP